MILSVPFCPYHFVPCHFVLQPFILTFILFIFVRRRVCLYFGYLFNLIVVFLLLCCRHCYTVGSDVSAGDISVQPEGGVRNSQPALHYDRNIRWQRLWPQRNSW